MIRYKTSRGARGFAQVLNGHQPIGWVMKFGHGDWRAKLLDDGDGYPNETSYATRALAANAVQSRAEGVQP